MVPPTPPVPVQGPTIKVRSPSIPTSGKESLSISQFSFSLCRMNSKHQAHASLRKAYLALWRPSLLSSRMDERHLANVKRVMVR